MRLYRTSVKDDLNVSVVFQHLAENYVNKVRERKREGITYIIAMERSQKIENSLIELACFEIGVGFCQDFDVMIDPDSLGHAL